MRAYAGRFVLVAATAIAAIAALALLWHTQPWGWYIAGLCAACALIAVLSILWSCKSVRYQISTQRLTIFTGLFSKHVDELELFRAKDVLVSQRLWQRMLNYGSVTILSTDDSTPHLTLTDIHAPLQAKELLRDAFREARRSAGIRATEFIQHKYLLFVLAALRSFVVSFCDRFGQRLLLHSSHETFAAMVNHTVFYCHEYCDDALQQC